MNCFAQGAALMAGRPSDDPARSYPGDRPSATILCDDKVLGIYDKGPGKGAVLYTERVIREKTSGDKLCTLVSSAFARGDGGFGCPREGAPEPHQLPTRAPDLVHECDTRPDQAFIYALSGDRNPLHRDPKVAEKAGFPKPILHGLCSYGTACRAIISIPAACWTLTVCPASPQKYSPTGFRPSPGSIRIYCGRTD